MSIRRLMSVWGSNRASPAIAQAGPPTERPLRLATGLILFAYATTHLINQAFGIRSIEAMEAMSLVLLAPWQTIVGLCVLYASLLTHAFLGLRAVYRRRHLRIPASELWQLAFGVTIPLLLVPHAAAIRIGTSAYGLEFGFHRVLYHFWVVSPDVDLPRQYLLLLFVWIHGCLGIRAWLRSKLWYPRATPALASIATLVPTLALLGFTNAGLNIRETAQRDPASVSRYAVAASDAGAAKNVASLRHITDTLSFLYLGLLTGTFGWRALRARHARRFRAVRITYPGNRVVAVSPGFSVLEASRWARIPHASVCGGRGRCSTCRVRVSLGAEHLDPPSPLELRTLERLGAAESVRLACQIRPRSDVTVEPLVRTAATIPSIAAGFESVIERGQEREIAALFVDLRESTRLAAGRLPYDALFLFDRYIQTVTAAVRENGGHVNGIAGDGVMSVFGLEGDAASAARNAFNAALRIWERVESLNKELANESEVPLRIGIGLHVGIAVVGLISRGDTRSLQFLGDTGNVAAKFEFQTKSLDCTLIASAEALALIVPHPQAIDAISLQIPGKEEKIRVVLFRNRNDLQRLLAQAALS